ncbi:MAG: aminotransferase class III-fold pyridoxal phosphate-dependent enzyme [Porticoccaceae bacterium]|nr:aminotransferase class III-fold pyridoxal phosphate-dependent enzyme [Porticoccaceae bacterium]
MPSTALKTALINAEKKYIASNPKSQTRYHEASRVMPGGNTRTVIFYSPFPVTFEKGEGAYLWDLDGHHYTDYLGEYSAGLYGHSHPAIRKAVVDSLDYGTVLGGPNLHETELAREICKRFPSCDLIRFCNSGTEANLLALCAARAITGRSHVLGFEGGYHGGVLKMFPNEALNVPIPMVLGQYNDIETTRELVKTHAGDLAAIIVEPMMGSGGAIPGDSAFLSYLRETADEHGIILIFDEVMTSRLSPGGLQSRLGIQPDLTSFGKYLGGGFSFGAFGGKAEIMSRFDPSKSNSYAHAGTFNNNIMSMTAGLAGLREAATTDALTQLNQTGDWLREEMNAAAKALSVAVQVTGVGSIMTMHFQTNPIHRPADITSAPEKHALIHLEMMSRGIYFARRGYMALSLALTDEDHQRMLSAFKDFLSDNQDALH